MDMKEEQDDEWTIIAPRYHHLPLEPVHTRIASFALAQLANQRAPRVVIDYGTGLGQPALTMGSSLSLEKSDHIFAFDSCKEMLRIAKAKATERPLAAKVSFAHLARVPDASALQNIIGPRPVDLTISSFTVSYFSPERRAEWLRALSSVAKKYPSSPTRVVVVNWGPKHRVPWLWALKHFATWTFQCDNISDPICKEDLYNIRAEVKSQEQESEPKEDSFALGYRKGSEGYVQRAGEGFRLVDWQTEVVDVHFKEGADELFRFFEEGSAFRQGSRADHVDNLFQLVRKMDQEATLAGQSGFLTSKDPEDSSQPLTFATEISIASIDIATSVNH